MTYDRSNKVGTYNGRYGVMTDNNGLYYMRARYYNPDIKRFINQDVVLGSINDGRTMNRYAYVNGNPISYVDPFGLSADSDGFLGFVHSALDVLGFIPGIGEICDGVNGVIYLLEGDYKNAFLSSICMIPMLGDVLGKGAKWGKEALENGAKFFIRHSDEALEIAEFGIKHFDEVGDSAKYFDEAAEIASNKGKSNFLHIDVQFFASKGVGKPNSKEIFLDTASSHDSARKILIDELDSTGAFKNGSNSYQGRLKSSYGYEKQIGRQSLDGKVRWRLDFDEKIGVHYNIEDFSKGKRVNAVKKVIPIDISEQSYKKIIDLWNR